jgi:hypothetical protein
MVLMVVDQNIDSSFARIREITLACAKKAIPRGKTKRHATFWTEELTKLKTERDGARDAAEISGSRSDRMILKEKSKTLRRLI